MSLYRDEVIVLASRDVGENDRIYTFYGRRKGKFRAVARGGRRISSRRRGHLGTFNICRILCAEGKSLDVLVEAESTFLRDPSEISKDELERAGLAAMALNKLVGEEDPDPELYRQFERYIKGSFDEVATVVVVTSILKLTGFLSPEQEMKLPLEDGKKLVILRRYINKILDTL